MSIDRYAIQLPSSDETTSIQLTMKVDLANQKGDQPPAGRANLYRCSATTDHDLYTRFSGPFNRLVQVLLLSRDVRFPFCDVKCPVPDGQTDVVEPSGGDLIKVVLCNERVPVGLKCSRGGLPVLIGAERVLVDDGLV